MCTVWLNAGREWVQLLEEPVRFYQWICHPSQLSRDWNRMLARLVSVEISILTTEMLCLIIGWSQILTYQLSGHGLRLNNDGYYHNIWCINNKPWSRSVSEVDLACAPLLVLSLWEGWAAEADINLPLVDGLICRSKSTTPESLLRRWSIDSCFRSSLAILRASISCI